jgi:hypothetical protein
MSIVTPAQSTLCQQGFARGASINNGLTQQRRHYNEECAYNWHDGAAASPSRHASPSGVKR